MSEDRNDTDSSPDGTPKPTLHPPTVHTMGMGHLPLTIFATVAISGLFALAFELGSVPPIAGIVFLVLLIAFAATAPKAPDGQRTAGTRFTVARVAITCLLCGLAVVPAGNPPEPLLWSLVLLGITAAGLEAVDGWLARITGSASGFSEKLGTMAGALLVLALALLVWRLGLAGIWVIAPGILGFAEAALLDGRGGSRATQRDVSRIVGELAVRVALAAAIAPNLPPVAVTALAVLATAAAIILMGQTLRHRFTPTPT